MYKGVGRAPRKGSNPPPPGGGVLMEVKGHTYMRTCICIFV